MKAPSQLYKKKRKGEEKEGEEEGAGHFDSQLGASPLYKKPTSENSLVQPTSLTQNFGNFWDTVFLRADVKRHGSQLSGSCLTFV